MPNTPPASRETAQVDARMNEFPMAPAAMRANMAMSALDARLTTPGSALGRVRQCVWGWGVWGEAASRDREGAACTVGPQALVGGGRRHVCGQKQAEV